MQYVPYIRLVDDAYRSPSIPKAFRRNLEKNRVSESARFFRGDVARISFGTGRFADSQANSHRAVLSIELAWQESGMQTYFVSPAAFAIISKSRFSVIGSDVKPPKHKVFSVSFPDNEKSVFSNITMITAPEDFNASMRHAAAIYCSNGDALAHAYPSVFGPGFETESIVATCYPGMTSDAFNCCAFADAGVFPEYIERPSGPEDAHEAGDTHDARVLSTGQFSVRLLAYLQAFPDALIPGAPPKNSTQQRADPDTSHIVSLPERFRNIPVSHLRGGHFRALRDAKFRRNADGSIRIIYVNPCIVGDIDPYHVDETPRTESGKPPI